MVKAESRRKATANKPALHSHHPLRKRGTQRGDRAEACAHIKRTSFCSPGQFVCSNINCYWKILDLIKEWASQWENAARRRITLLCWEVNNVQRAHACRRSACGVCLHVFTCVFSQISDTPVCEGFMEKSTWKKKGNLDENSCSDTKTQPPLEFSSD